MQRGMNLLYPTKVFYDKMKHPDLSKEVLDSLMVNTNFADPVVEKLGQDLLDLEIPEVSQWIDQEVYPAFDAYLLATVGKSISDFGDYKFKSWLTGTQGNYHLLLHNHRGSTISGVFYLLAEETTLGGDLVFCDPRTNSNRGYHQPTWNQEFDYTTIKPSTGDYYIFPSFLYHFVMPYAGSLRICLPVDLHLFAEP